MVQIIVILNYDCLTNIIISAFTPAAHDQNGEFVLVQKCTFMSSERKMMTLLTFFQKYRKCFSIYHYQWKGRARFEFLGLAKSFVELAVNKWSMEN